MFRYWCKDLLVMFIIHCRRERNGQYSIFLRCWGNELVSFVKYKCYSLSWFNSLSTEQHWPSRSCRHICFKYLFSVCILIMFVLIINHKWSTSNHVTISDVCSCIHVSPGLKRLNRSHAWYMPNRFISHRRRLLCTLGIDSGTHIYSTFQSNRDLKYGQRIHATRNTCYLCICTHTVCQLFTRKLYGTTGHTPL